MTGTSSFIIQSHNTKRPHYDLLIEKGGEIRSWILPRGIPEKVSGRRIAIEEHVLTAGKDKGVTEDLYGQGDSSTWDSGGFALHTENKIKYIFTAHGTKLSGKFLLHNPGWGRWTKKKLWVLEKVAS